MKFSDLLSGTDAKLELHSGADPEIDFVTDDSRRARARAAFIAVRGGKFDGHDFITKAMATGASAIVAERDATAEERALGSGTRVAWAVVPDTRAIVGKLAHRAAGDPTAGMIIAGVTGTNGKTTTAWLIDSIFRAAGLQSGLLGTIGYRVGEEWKPAPNTTATACENAAMLRDMRAGGAAAAAMEVSSHALDQGRVDGIHFRVGVLTNITQDHLDYHGTMENYAAAKQQLFDEILPREPGASAVFNLDDPYGHRMAYACPVPWLGFTQKRDTDAAIRCLAARVDLNGITIDAAIHDKARTIHAPNLIGRFNVENILAAVGAGVAAGMEWDAIARGMEQARGVPGRFERISEGQPFLVAVDYAHTPDALERALDNARELTTGRLIAVFGCGGDRDKGKRPKMGRAAGERADFAILTSDNPRTEDPASIVEMAAAGLREAASRDKYETILDRREAIGRAIGLARAGDFVLIAGKGHEDYQEIMGVKNHFDDREEAREAIKRAHI